MKSGGMGPLIWAESRRIVRRPAWLITWVYGILWELLHGASAAPGPPMARALGAPGVHATLLTMLGWLSLPIACVIGLGSPAAASPGWLRYLLLRHDRRLTIWLAIMTVRLGLGMVWGGLVLAAGVIPLMLRPDSMAWIVPWGWLLGGLLGALWWVEAIVAAVGRSSLAWGVALVANYVFLALTATGMSLPFLGPAVGPTLSALVTHDQGMWFGVWTCMTVGVGYGIGFLQFRSASL